MIFSDSCVIMYTTNKYFCLVRVIIVFIIQHILLGNSAPCVDCRPPAFADEGSVKGVGVYPPASCGFYALYDGKADFFAFFSVCPEDCGVFCDKSYSIFILLMYNLFSGDAVYGKYNNHIRCDTLCSSRI